MEMALLLLNTRLRRKWNETNMKIFEYIRMKAANLCDNYLFKGVIESVENDMTAVEKFLFWNRVYNRNGHNDSHYKEWRMRRLAKVLNIYGVDWFDGKKVLVLGDGQGFIGAFFAEIGATVLSLEGRIENASIAKLQYRNLQNFTIKQFDLSNDFTHFGKFDLIVNWGLLEVVNCIENILTCCSKMSNDLLVETIVCDSADKVVSVNVYRKASASNDTSLTDSSTVPSACMVESFFESRGYKTERYFDADINTPVHKYDWKCSRYPNIVLVREWQRRFWRFRK